ncbi:MAG TPA: CHAP domain-containing protein [Candidatus Saccharimonadales bacterium]|nr:CHAP domain-containing protein [Candidatus Saccharimonadales bacterium]
MHTQSLKKVVLNKFRLLAALLVSGALIGGVTLVHADQYDNQINSLQQSNSAKQGILNGLANQAATYQAEIDRLQDQINAIQSVLRANQAKQAAVQAQIVADQQKIDQEKKYLGDDIRSMYVGGQLSTIEELATSKNLSDYVDKEEYQTRIQNQLSATIAQVRALEVQLQKQKDQLDILIKTEQRQNDQLADVQWQHQKMLAYTQEQQTAYDNAVKANESKIAELRAEQAAANRQLDGSGYVVTSGSCGGSYPASASGAYGSWGCNFAHTSDDVPGCQYSDSWGMCNRECVSYTAWMVYERYGIDTSGFGNANQWPGSARSVGISTGYTPKVGSVAIYTGGTFGHAMWVVGVSGGQIHVYSYNDNYDGNFYDHWVSASGLTYIYF